MLDLGVASSIFWLLDEVETKSLKKNFEKNKKRRFFLTSSQALEYQKLTKESQKKRRNKSHVRGKWKGQRRHWQDFFSHHGHKGTLSTWTWTSTWPSPFSFDWLGSRNKDRSSHFGNRPVFPGALNGRQQGDPKEYKRECPFIQLFLAGRRVKYLKRKKEILPIDISKGPGKKELIWINSPQKTRHQCVCISFFVSLASRGSTCPMSILHSNDLTSMDVHRRYRPRPPTESVKMLRCEQIPSEWNGMNRLAEGILVGRVQREGAEWCERVFSSLLSPFCLCYLHLLGSRQSRWTSFWAEWTDTIDAIFTNYTNPPIDGQRLLSRGLFDMYIAPSLPSQSLLSRQPINSFRFQHFSINWLQQNKRSRQFH